VRLTLFILVTFGLWLGYAISPFVSVYRLIGVVAERNVSELSERVDFPALRTSLAAQIATTYLRITGKAIDPESIVDRLAVGVAASIAAPLVAEMISPEGLLDLLQQGRPSAAILSDSIPTPGGLNSEALGNIWRAYLNSELGIGRFFLNVPVDKPRDERFKLAFCLRGFTWQLCAIELPEPLQISLAQELVRRGKQ